MRPKKYPLDPLVRVRAKQVDDAARLLAEATRAREEAERRRAAAAEREEEARRAAASLRDAERGALERGELTVADLMRGDAWAVRVKDEHAELGRRTEDSAAKARQATAGESVARVEVAGRKADAELVERHRGRWAEGERKADEARDEEAAAEAWRPKS